MNPYAFYTGSIYTSSQYTKRFRRTKSAIGQQTYLIIKDLGIPDPIGPHSGRTGIATEKDRLVGLDARNDGLFEGRRRGVDIYIPLGRSTNRSRKQSETPCDSHRTDNPPETFPSLSTVYSFS